MPDSLHSALFNPLTHQFGRKAILVLWAVDSHLLSRCMAFSPAACIITQFSQEPGSKTACLSSCVTPITVLRDYGGSPIWVHWTTLSQGEARVPGLLGYRGHIQTFQTVHSSAFSISTYSDWLDTTRCGMT